MKTGPKLAAFPKCYIDQIAGARTMSVFDWVEMARTLDADGLEMYEGFFTSLADGYIDSVGEALTAAGFAMPMLCCSPDFTQPRYPGARQRAVAHEAEMIRITRRLGGPRAVCRVLSGQRRPEVQREQGIQWVVECIQELLPVARDYDVVLGMENHYKDGFWKFPEFAESKPVFMEILQAIPEHAHFGVQVPSFKRDCRGRRSARLAARSPGPRREHARERPMAVAGCHTGRTPPERRHTRIFGEASAWSDGQRLE